MATDLDVDLDDLHAAWSDMAKYERLVYTYERQLESYIANIQKRLIEDSSLWPNGKQPTVFFLEKIVPAVGLTSEDAATISNLHHLIGQAKSDYTKARGTVDELHERIKIWQTKSANARKVLSVE